MNTWLTWGFILLLQNFSFTFVSRARNSGSLQRHLIAGLLSNGVWFVSQIYAVSQIQIILEELKGGNGLTRAAVVAAFYTLMTVLGSLVSHWYCLKTEKGTAMVGARKDYVQLTMEDYKAVRKLLADTGVVV